MWLVVGPKHVYDIYPVIVPIVRLIRNARNVEILMVGSTSTREGACGLMTVSGVPTQG